LVIFLTFFKIWLQKSRIGNPASCSTLQVANDDALRPTLKYVYYLINAPKIIRRCYSR